MFIATVIISVVLAVALVASAAMKLQRNPQVVAAIHDTVGVPMRWLPILAALEVAGAVGLIVGLWWAPLGIAAAIGVIAYFVGAVIAHLRVGDTKGLAGPTVPLLLAITALVLRSLSA